MSDLASTTSSVSSATPGAGGPLASMRSTGQFGVIVFLASDVMLFAPFFAAYFLLRAGNQPWPPEGVELDTLRAAVFTVVLVASSFTLVASDRAAERADDSGQRRWLLATIGLGAAFLANQLAEYATLPFSADDDVYGSVYWVLTGLHGAHVTAGLIAMGLLFVRSARAESVAAIGTWTGGVSLFWHLVDVIWLFVFATIWIIQ